MHNALEKVELQDAKKKFPSEVSGGMQKRAGLARAIVTEPEILLYDEPTSGLDPIMSRRIDRLIIDMQKTLNVTSIVVTHDLLSALEISDKIAMLHECKFGFIGTPREFLDSDKDYVQEFISAQGIKQYCKIE